MTFRRGYSNCTGPGYATNLSPMTFRRGYSNCTGPGYAMHSDIVMPYISHAGTPEQIERFIPDMTAGKKIGALAMTEPGAGR